MPETQKKFPFKLGADPEFNFTIQNRQNSRLRADALLREFFADKPSSNSGYNLSAGNAGWDGNSATGEIRPKPAFSPKELTQNIGSLLGEINKRSPKAIKMSVRSEMAPVGGHIHFELDTVSKATSRAQMSKVQRILSTFYLPIMFGEDRSNLLLRTKGGYGRFSDGRMENGITYEYRSPSAEWLITPKICESTLAFLGAVWYEAIHRPATFKKKNVIWTNDSSGDGLQQLLIRGYELIEGALLHEVRALSKKLEFYPMFKEEIDYILSPTKVMKDKEDAHFCIDLGWKFDTSKPPVKKEINNVKKINELLGHTDVDRWLQLFKIPYNPDTNVKDFVDELKKRILAFDWTLENEYYMFGMRKGIEKTIAQTWDGKFLMGKDQIKTKLDLKAINDVFNRVKSKTCISSTNRNKTIIIGMPYEQRLNRDFKPFINMIYDLEKKENVYKPEVLKTEELHDDTKAMKAEDRGKIHEIMNKPLENENLVEESNRFTVRNEMERMPYGMHPGQMQELFREAQQAEREENPNDDDDCDEDED